MRTLSDLPLLPAKLQSSEFNRDMYAHYQWMLREAPICRAKLSVMNVVMVAPYAECRMLLKDPRFVRNRATATGGRAFPVPLPRAMKLVMKGLITQDDPIHKRQRGLVAKAFTPTALARIERRVGTIVDSLLDELEPQREVDLIEAFCLPIPVTVIREMLGIGASDMPQFQQLLSNLTDGMTGFAMFKTLVWNFPRTIQFVDEMLERKRANPGDDILTALIQAEADGERLSHDELVAMTLTLVLAGYETTVHLLGNAAVTLLDYPEQRALLAADPSLVDSAVEEVLRFHGPIHGTKPNYAREDLDFMGVRIPRGTPVIPALAAANRDPAKFERPNVFDIQRTPNAHLGFGFGIHHCLGAALARMETRIAIRKLVERLPNLQLAVPERELKRQPMPLWHRYDSIPVKLRF